MFRLLHCLNCHSLRSAYFRRFRRYYEVVRLLPTRRLVLGFLGLGRVEETLTGLLPHRTVLALLRHTALLPNVGVRDYQPLVP